MMYKTSDLSVVRTQYYLQHLVAPRPICFASTINHNGQVNLSPFSFFNLFSTDPPIVIFSPSRRLRDNTTKHTLENIREVPQVVINIMSYGMVQQASLSSCEYPKGVDEFLKAGFTKEKASFVQPPMVKESPAKLECSVDEIKSLGENGGAGQLVIAKVVCMHIDDVLLTTDEQFIQENLDLVARLGGDWYARIDQSSLFKVEKPHSRLGIGVDALPDNIRNSEVLTGNHLGQLANVPRMPTLTPGLQNERINKILSTSKDSYQTRSIHIYAQELLEQGKTDEAWQVLLYGSD